MYNAVVAKSPGKVFNYFRTLRPSLWHLTQSGVRNTHTGGVCLTVRPKKIKNRNLYFLVIFEE